MNVVKIGGVPYTVTFVEDWRRVDHSEEETGFLRGQISYKKNSIRIDGDQTPEGQSRTLMHELIHGVVEHYKIRELMGDEGGHLENPIDQLAVGVCEVLESLGIFLHAKAR